MRRARAVALAAAALLATTAAASDVATINLQAFDVSVVPATDRANRWAKEVDPVKGQVVTVRCQILVSGSAPGSTMSAGWWVHWIHDGFSDGLYFKVPIKVALTADDQVLAITDLPNMPLRYGQNSATHPAFSNAGELTLVQSDWMPLKEGTHEIGCVVDAAHLIAESLENDNRRVEKVQVAGLQQPASGAPLGTSPAAVPPPAAGGSGTARDAGGAAGRARTPGSARKPPDDRPAGEAVPSRPRPGAATSKEFSTPKWKDTRVDWCLHWGAACGEPAASEYCKRSGYAKATAWSQAEDVGDTGPTLVLGDDKLCTAPSCDSFAAITCTH